MPAEHDAVHVEQTRLEDAVHAALMKFSDGQDDVHVVHEVALPSTVKFEPREQLLHTASAEFEHVGDKYWPDEQVVQFVHAVENPPAEKDPALQLAHCPPTL